MLQRLADGVFAIVGAACLSQFPEFFRQYLQRLGGRFDQAAVQEGRIAAAARDHGLTLTDYAHRLLDNADPVARSEGLNVFAALADAERLRAAYGALAAANPLERPWLLARYFDADVARATLDQFAPAVPLGAEGLVYAGVGMVLGLAVLAGLQATGRVALRRRSRRRARYG